jgi:hypothetical protein
MSLLFSGPGDAWVTLDLPSHPTELFITCEVWIPATEIAWMTDVNGGEFVVNVHSDYGDKMQGVSFQPFSPPLDYAWFDQNDGLFPPLAHPIVTAGAYTVSIHCTANPGVGDASAVTINADSVSTAAGSGNSNSYATYYDRVDFGLYNSGGVSDARRSLYIRNITVGTTLGGTDLISNAGTTSGWSSITGTVTEDAFPEVVATTNGGVRVGIAFNDPTLEPSPTWTYLTDTPNLVAGYTKDVGRKFEFDRTDTGTAEVTINDTDGLLDPTNAAGPYYGLLEPLLQIQIELWNPCTSTYKTRFRGFIEDFNYDVAPSVRQDGTGATVGVTRLKISCFDLFALLTAIEMQPDGRFGDAPPTANVGNIFYDNETAHDRITHVLGDAGIAAGWARIFTLNVWAAESVYSPGDNVLQVIQDMADAELPTVANAYVTRSGLLAVHGRLAVFDPDGTAADAGAAWDFTRWKVGDGKAVAASPTDTAHIRQFAYNRGYSHIANYALCTPNGIDPVDISGQVVSDVTSIGQFGIQPWSAENLLIAHPTSVGAGTLHDAGAGILTGNSALDECLAYATFIVNNDKQAKNRVTQITFRSQHPDAVGAEANWNLLCGCDIADVVEVTVRGPGDAAGAYIFNAEPFLLLGIHEEVTPLNPDYANVTISLDLEPLPTDDGSGLGVGL